MAVLSNISSSRKDIVLLNNSHEENLAYSDMTEETRRIVEKVWFLGFISPACFIGIPSNIINCLVFRRQGLQDKMNLCLLFLAFVDLLHLLCTFAIFSVSSFVHFYDDILGEEFYVKTLAWFSGELYALRAASCFIGVVIAVERCLCVVYPLRASTLIRTRTMSILLIAAFLLFQCFYVTYPITLGAVWSKRKTTDTWHLVNTQLFFDNQFLFDVLQAILFDSTVPIASFLIMVVTTTMTILKLKRQMSWRHRTAAQTNNIDRHQAALTIMLVIVSIAHIVTITPFVAWQIVYFYLPDRISTVYNTFMTYKGLTNSFPAINSSIHFWIFYFRSSRFREVLCSMCSPFCKLFLPKQNLRQTQ